MRFALIKQEVFQMVVNDPLLLNRYILDYDFATVIKLTSTKPMDIDKLEKKTNISKTKLYRLIQETKKYDFYILSCMEENNKVGRKRIYYMSKIRRIRINYDIEKITVTFSFNDSRNIFYYFPIDYLRLYIQ